MGQTWGKRERRIDKRERKRINRASGERKLVRPNKDTPQLPFTFYLTHLLFEKKYLQRFDRAQKESMFAYRKAFRKRRASKKVAGEQVEGGTEEKKQRYRKKKPFPMQFEL